MSNSEQKKQWKKDAKQLKEDLDNRSKVFQKREVPIRFLNKEKATQTDPLRGGSTQTDHYLKDQINFT